MRRCRSFGRTPCGGIPEIQAAMDRLAGKVKAEEMQRMNDAVDAQHRDVGDVVREWREARGI